MRIPSLTAVLFVLCSASVFAQQKGDQMVVTSEEVQLRAGSEVTGQVYRGIHLHVVQVEGDWVWVVQSGTRPLLTGWIERQHIIPASEALDFFTDELNREPSAGAFGKRALVWLHAGEFDNAIADCSEAIRRDPSSGDTWRLRGNARAGKGEYEKAVEDFTDAIRVDDDSALPYFYRGLARQELGEHDGAIEDFSEAIRLDPADARPLNDRAIAWFTKGEYDKAIADYDAAIELYPEYATAYSNRGNAWLQKEEHDKAIADYGEAIRLDPDEANPYLNRATARRELGELELAMSDYEAALERNPEFVIAYEGRARTYYDQAEYPQAIADYDRAIELDPANLAARNSLAWLLATCPEEYFRDGQRAVKLAAMACEQTDWEDWGPIDTLAAAAAEAGDFEAAVQWQEMSQELAPERHQTELAERLALYVSERPYHETAKASPEMETLATTDDEDSEVSLADVTTGGTLWLRDEAYPLNHAIAYKSKFFDDDCTVVLLTTEPLPERKLRHLQRMLTDEESDDSFFVLEVNVKLTFDEDGDLAYIFAWADNVSINGNSGFESAFQQRDGRVRGKATMREPEALFDSTYRIDVAFDVELIK